MKRSRGEYIAKRLFFAFVTVFVIVTLNFFLFRLVPGSPLNRLAGPRASVEDRNRLRQEFGLDDSVFKQYTAYLNQVAHGNLGLSYRNSEPVVSVVWDKLKISIPMVLLGEAFAISFGIITGVIAAARRRTWFDRGSTTAALIFYSFPTQWFGMMMILFFAPPFPSGGRTDFFASYTGVAYLLDVLKHMVLPSLTLGLVLYGEYTLIVRSAMLESLGEDYVLTARAKGLPRRRIIWRHAFRNALLPVVTLIALSLAYVVAGSVLVETVFSWPGIGYDFYNAVFADDWPVMQAILLVLTLFVVFGNLIADLLLFKLDPRITE